MYKMYLFARQQATGNSFAYVNNTTFDAFKEDFFNRYLKTGK